MKERWAVAGLIAVLAAELVFAARTDGITVDEPVYISAGFRHLTALDFRLDPETPPLAKMLAALPLLPLGLHVPLAPGEWGWIYRFFHENSASRMIACLSRLSSLRRSRPPRRLHQSTMGAAMKTDE